MAHIMNWMKSGESLQETSSRVFASAVKWAKGQRTFASLPLSDQLQLANESLAELFVLQMAETKSSLNEGYFIFI